MLWEIICYNFFVFVLYRIRAILLARNCLIMWDCTTLDILQKLSNCLLENMTLVSSANIMASHKLCIVGGRLFVYIRKASALELNP
jgi:hypothetical protein